MRVDLDSNVHNLYRLYPHWGLVWLKIRTQSKERVNVKWHSRHYVDSMAVKYYEAIAPLMVGWLVEKIIIVCKYNSNSSFFQTVMYAMKIAYICSCNAYMDAVFYILLRYLFDAVCRYSRCQSWHNWEPACFNHVFVILSITPNPSQLNFWVKS